MKNIFLIAAVFSISTFTFASNISSNDDIKSNHSQMNSEQISGNVLQNEKLQRLHKQMTREAMSEGGMEARLEMMTEEGRAYHEALEQRKKSTAG